MSTLTSTRRSRRSVAAVVLVLCAAALSAVSSPAEAATGVTATASSSAKSDPAALVDGDIAAGRLGGEWFAATTDVDPWVRLSWSAPRPVASIQVFGSTANAFDPKQSTAAALHGVLRFSDGSTVEVSGIAPAAGMPTVVAFAPRETTSVTLELDRQIPNAVVALREFEAYEVGTSPDEWSPPASSPSYAVTPPAAVCTRTSPSLSATVAGRLALACPTPGSRVGDSAFVVLDAPAGTTVVAWASWPSASGRGMPLRRVASGTANASGRVALGVNTRLFPQGPFALKVTATGTAGAQTSPLYVQLFKSKGASVSSASHEPAGSTLQYSDDFDDALSISQTGWGTQYAAVKPERWGGSQFGFAVFADPAWGAGTLATLPGGYLRIRAQDIGAYTDKQSWGQRHISGILSSQRFGGSGFSAQHGYFEARLLGAPGPGAWPAFWMLNSESGTGRADGTAGELDAVELYGHETKASCHTTHAWATPVAGQLMCPKSSSDWAAQWHTYGVQVLDGGAEFFVDGTSIGRLDELSHTDEPFFFMLDLATGGGWPVDLSATGQTTDMYVDWVRVWT